MQKHIATTGCVALVLFGATVLAQTSFDRVDTDGDGSITKDEYYGMVSDAGIYPDHDRDDDGFVDEDEFNENGLNDHADFDTWDLDNDRFLTSGEFYDGAFANYDVDENGHWDGDEWDDAGEAGLFDF